MRASRFLAVFGAVLVTLPATAAEPAAGQQASGPGQGLFNNHCRTCHSVQEGDSRLGPSLKGIVGAKPGTRAGYSNYSQAMTSAALVWDEAALDRFIADPEAVVPNNNMKPYKGIGDQAVRKQIVDFLKSQGGSP